MPYKILRLSIILFLISPLAQLTCIESPKNNNEKQRLDQNEYTKLKNEYFSILDTILISSVFISLHAYKEAKKKYKAVKKIHRMGGYKIWYENQKALQVSSNELTTEKENKDYQMMTKVLNDPEKIKAFIACWKRSSENTNKNQKTTN